MCNAWTSLDIQNVKSVAYIYRHHNHISVFCLLLFFTISTMCPPPSCFWVSTTSINKKCTPKLMSQDVNSPWCYLPLLVYVFPWHYWYPRFCTKTLVWAVCVPIIFSRQEFSFTYVLVANRIFRLISGHESMKTITSSPAKFHKESERMFKSRLIAYHNNTRGNDVMFARLVQFVLKCGWHWHSCTEVCLQDQFWLDNHNNYWSVLHCVCEAHDVYVHMVSLWIFIKGRYLKLGKRISSETWYGKMVPMCAGTFGHIPIQY
jgi:hypothetical protein